MKIAGNEVKDIEILEPEKLKKVFGNFLKKVEYPQSVLDYVRNNKWISIPNKNLYFNKEIIACYPNFLSNECPDLRYYDFKNTIPTVVKALNVIKNQGEFTKYNINWDIQTLNESKNSFYNKTHPMESGSDAYHRIQGWGCFLYKTDNGMMEGYDNKTLESWKNAVLIPIFRLGRKEDHDAFNTNGTAFDYEPKTITLLFILNDLIPDFGREEINNEYKELYDEIHEKYGEYIKGVHVNEDKKAVVDFNLDKVGKEIAAGDSEKIFGENRLKFTLKNEDIVEIEFDCGEIKSGDYTYKNGDKEVCSYKRDENGDFLRTGKSALTKANGNVEKLIYTDGVPQGKSTFTKTNGDKEKRNYKDGVLQEGSEYIYANGDKETRTYVDGKLYGEAVFYLANGEESKRYWYENNEKRDITAMRRILDVDKIRVNLSSYDENILADPNRGHWDLFGVEDIEDIEAGLGRKVYRRDPKKDIKRGGIVGIDFGTKSTVVVFQDDNNRTLPMRISGGNLVSEVKKDDYENPTVIEFRDIESFMKDYNEKEGRPLTKWEDVTVSHTAFQNLLNGTSDEFYSIISDLKQWAGVKNEKIVIRDKKGVETLFPPYMELEEGEKDPIELYAYYIGSYINNMINGIYLEYLLSFPVTYEKKIREKILQSFERGIKKSFPAAIIEDEETMKRFKVIHGANEPAAYAACALQEYGFEPDDDEVVYYGVFDFGGGTADFDFGIWKASEDERNFDYELTHFGAGGDRYLGGENILKELAYEVLKENQEILRKEKISFARPAWCERFVGDEGLVDNSPEGKLNIKMLMEKLRPFWENSSETNNDDGKLKANLYSKDGMLKTGVELKISKEAIDNLIESKIERGIENFFIALDKAMKDEEVDKINILLAGNSCKHPKVMELFEKHKDDFKGEIEIFPALGTDEAYAKMEELGLDTDSEDKTKPTGKTGVAYGIIDSRIGGRIDVKNRDEENNLNNEINFRYYVGYEGRKKLRVVLGPQTQYDKFVYYLDALPMFDIYYTSLPEAMESKMPIAKAKRKRIYLKDEYPGAKIYIKSVSPDTIKYAISEKDIEEKEYLEEGTIELD